MKRDDDLPSQAVDAQRPGRSPDLLAPPEDRNVSEEEEERRKERGRGKGQYL